MSIPTVCNRWLLAGALGTATSLVSYACFETEKKRNFGNNTPWIEPTKVGSLVPGAMAAGSCLAATSKRPGIAVPVVLLASLYLGNKIVDNSLNHAQEWSKQFRVEQKIDILAQGKIKPS